MLTAPEGSLAESGGASSITVTTPPECGWEAAAEASWITNLIPSQGQGNAEVRFQVSANPSASARESAIVVNNQRAIIRQAATPCRFSIGVSTTQFGAAGGTGTITVTVSGGCDWTASSDSSWITVAPLSGAGSGTVAFTVAFNSGTVRTGTVTVGGVPISIVQTAAGGAPPSCTVTLQPTSTSMAAAGGPITVAVNTGCAWTASSGVPWITLTTPASGTGNGTVTLSVAQNTGVARTGTVTIGGQTFTVNQRCASSISPTSRSVAAGVHTEQTVHVTTITGCAWIATSNASWLTITSGASGNGTGDVTYNVAANPAGVRTGTLTIADQTLTVTQQGN